MMRALHSVAEVLYLFAPLLLSAACSAVVMRFDWIAHWRRPIDAGCTWRGKRVFGDSKTWRGVLVAVLGCIAGVAAQKYLVGVRALGIARVDYASTDVVVFGAVMGASAMAGELPNSFVKRRLGIAPGGTACGWLSFVFYAWDQIDLLTLCWPAIASWVRIDAGIIVASFAVTLLLHPLTSLLGYAFGARKSAR